MSKHPEPSERWIMWAGGTPPLDPPPAPPEWVQAIANAPTGTVGELDDCSLLSGAVPQSWQCAVIPGYILPHSCLASIATPNGGHFMLFFHNHGPALHQQPRPVQRGLIGWFQVRIVEPILSREALDRNIANALNLLARAGHVPSVNSGEGSAR